MKMTVVNQVAGLKRTTKLIKFNNSIYRFLRRNIHALAVPQGMLFELYIVVKEHSGGSSERLSVI